jgi:hypothetical protein
MKRIMMMGLLFSLMIVSAKAQDLALKTNVLYDATSTINLGAELGLAPKWTLDVSGNLNPWKFNNDKMFKHWMVQPEARYWFCEKFNGSFIGAHLMGGEFDASNVKLPFGICKTLRDHRYEGWFAGLGAVYGYQWMMSKHWNLEGAIGAGYDYIHYDKYRCGKCGTKLGDGHTNYFGITKLDLSLVYLF